LRIFANFGYYLIDKVRPFYINDSIEKIEIAGPGFINFYVKKSLAGTPKLNIAAPVELAATTVYMVN